MLSHRYVFIKLVGELSENEVACHKCDNPSCCNPNHLFKGTPGDNTRDMLKKGRGNYGMNPIMGSSHYLSKLNEGDIPVILNRLKNGESTYSVARSYGVAQGRISSIKLNKSWKHVLRT